MEFKFAITATSPHPPNVYSDQVDITMAKRPLAPNVINNLDDSLLRNRPDTWSTRIHLVVYYWFIFSIALTALYFVVPDNPLESTNIGFWIASQVILVIVGLILWMIYLFRFNTFKSYGTVFPGDRIKTYFFYFMTILLLTSTVFIPPVIETYKTSIRYSTEEVSDDMNRMNVLLARLAKEEVGAEITVDTIYIVDYNNAAPVTVPSTYDYDDSLGVYYKEPLYLSRDELRWTLSEQDSIVWINKDKLLRYTVSNLQYINDYDIIKHSEVKILRNFDIYNLVYKNNIPEEKSKLEREFNSIADKYRTGNSELDYSWQYNTSDPIYAVTGKYGLYEINNSLRNISSRLYRWEEEDLRISIRVALYISMFLALCIFVFRHSTIRTFFLSVLFAVLLAIFSGIIMALLRFDEWGAMATVIAYYIFFLVFALSTVTQKVRSVFAGIAMNLTVILTPFMPLLCVGMYYEYVGHNYYYYDSMSQYNDPYGMEFDRSTELLHYSLAEIFGFIILLILIETVFKWMFRKWYASPEE